MSWQDWIIAIGQGVFAIALAPMLAPNADKPAFFSSLLTGLVLIAFIVVFLSLNLLWGAFTTALCCFIWLTLAWQMRPWKK